ncbi:MAG: DUF11 domain-containing protein, partial [Calditrichaeota bacterium]|nr:DUF11 domain-containing protein [Calditrichota bacterium]
MKKYPPSQTIRNFIIFLFVLFVSNAFPQSSDNVFIAKLIDPNFRVYVDGLPDSAARHTSIDRVTLTTDQAGWYRIFFHLAYSGDAQLNEHVFVTVVNGDSIITPLDKNLGMIKVLRDTSAVPDTLWRNTGLFYLLPGENQILMHHYNAVFKEQTSRQLVANVPESELMAIVVGDSIGDRQSVHIDSMIIYGHPNFRALTDLTKKDRFIDADGSNTLSVGDVIEYTIEISNSGKGIAHDIFVTDTIPANTAYISGSGSTTKGTIQTTSPVFEVEIGNMAPGSQERVTISYQVRVTSPTDSVKNQGFLNSEENDSIPTDDPDTDEEDDPTITVVPDFTGATDLTKSDSFFDANDNGKIDAGDSIRYTITVKNSGQGTAHNVVFTDSIPNYTQYVQGSAFTSKGTIAATSPVLRVEIGSVAPNESETVTISFTVLVTESITMVANQGYLDSDET